MNKYEKLIEYIISEQEDRARELFHEIVVEKSRNIYESLVEADDELGGDEVEDLIADIEADEDGIAEATAADREGPADLLAAVEEEINSPGKHVDNLTDVMNATFGSDRSPEFKHARKAIAQYLEFVTNAHVDHPSDDPDDDEPMIGAMTHGDIARHIQEYDLTDYLDDAAAELEQIVGLAEAEGNDIDLDDVDMEMDADEEIEDRVEDLESALDELKAEFDALMTKEQDDSDMDMDMDMDADQGDADMVREYVEKVSAPANAEGHEAAAGGSVAVNKKSSVARKNDMGGTAANTVRGGSEANPDGVKPKSADNYGTKARGDLPHAGKYENVPGAKTKGYVNKRDAKKGEESGVNTKSVESGK
jgi:hypothetical protein